MILGSALVDSSWFGGFSELVIPFSMSRGVSGAGELAVVEVERDAGRMFSSIAGKKRWRRRILHRCERASQRAHNSKQRVRARITTTIPSVRGATPEGLNSQTTAMVG